MQDGGNRDSFNDKIGKSPARMPPRFAQRSSSRVLFIVKGNDTGLEGFQTDKVERNPILRLHGFE